MMRYRNPRYAADGRIDCEIEHPQYGWIPFTADPADPQAGLDVAALLAEITQHGQIASYVPPEPPGEQSLADKKRARQEKVDAIVVTTASGKSFDGNEEAQNRMARALAGMDNTDVLPWVLADNRIADIDKRELREALRLAGQAQAALWIEPYR